MKQLEMKLLLEGEEMETFMEIALSIQNHLQTLETLLKTKLDETQEND
tara:strand:- start:4873 stop:5016 length:144 start_codon:yes stop_codon:yes gene_type:complete